MTTLFSIVVTLVVLNIGSMMDTAYTDEDNNSFSKAFELELGTSDMYWIDNTLLADKDCFKFTCHRTGYCKFESSVSTAWTSGYLYDWDEDNFIYRKSKYTSGGLKSEGTFVTVGDNLHQIDLDKQNNINA